MRPAIVIAAHRRPVALARLLASIDRAAYPPRADIPLVISIDPLPEGDPAAPDGLAVLRLAEDFGWRHGPKTIQRRPGPLGLVTHFIACGELSRTYGSIVFLEDQREVADRLTGWAEAKWMDPR